MLPKVFAAAILVCSAHGIFAQGISQVGTWNVDISESDFGGAPVPRSITMNILEDSPQKCSWRVDTIDDKGNKSSFSWSGPEDGTLHPVMDPSGKILLRESLKKTPDGTLLRHGEDPDGSSFDGLAKMSADGTSIVDTVKSRGKDGKQSMTQKYVAHRVSRTAK
jgi:hypothetical protein